jgi:hypothetical protein
MRRALPALVVLALTVSLAVPATAATPSPKKMAAQIRVLQKQVKALRREVNIAQGLALVGLLYGACNSAVTADALQGSNPTALGTTPVTDYSPVTRRGTACGDLSRFTGHTVARQPNTATVSVFQSLLNIFKP